MCCALALLTPGVKTWSKYLPLCQCSVHLWQSEGVMVLGKKVRLLLTTPQLFRSATQEFLSLVHAHPFSN